MKTVDPTSPATQKRWDTLTKSLARLGVVPSRMFGMPTLKLDGKAIGGLFGNSLVLKLQGDAHASALALAGAELFDPSGMGRPMKEWVVIPEAHAKEWGALTAKALAPSAVTAEARRRPGPDKKRRR